MVSLALCTHDHTTERLGGPVVSLARGTLVPEHTENILVLSIQWFLRECKLDSAWLNVSIKVWEWAGEVLFTVFALDQTDMHLGNCIDSDTSS